MPKKLRLAGVCPGPGYDKPCSSGRKGTPRGGRCGECRREAMRYWHREHHHGTPHLIDRRKGPESKAGRPLGITHSKRLAEEIATARAVEPDAIGIKGGLRIINSLLKQ